MPPAWCTIGWVLLCGKSVSCSLQSIPWCLYSDCGLVSVERLDFSSGWIPQQVFLLLWRCLLDMVETLLTGGLCSQRKDVCHIRVACKKVLPCFPSIVQLHKTTSLLQAIALFDQIVMLTVTILFWNVSDGTDVTTAGLFYLFHFWDIYRILLDRPQVLFRPCILVDMWQSQFSGPSLSTRMLHLPATTTVARRRLNGVNSEQNSLLPTFSA